MRSCKLLWGTTNISDLIAQGPLYGSTVAFKFVETSGHGRSEPLAHSKAPGILKAVIWWVLPSPDGSPCN